MDIISFLIGLVIGIPIGMILLNIIVVYRAKKLLKQQGLGKLLEKVMAMLEKKK